MTRRTLWALTLALAWHLTGLGTITAIILTTALLTGCTPP